MPAGVQELRTKAELLATTGGAAVVRYEVAEDPGPAFARDGAVLFLRETQNGHPDLVGLGAPGPLGALLDDLLPRLPEPLSLARGITVEAAAAPALAGRVAGPAAAWQIMTCTRLGGRDGVLPHGAALVALGADRHEEVRAFLDEHYTSRWTSPGTLVGEQWLGLERGGALLAAGCASLTPAGVVRLGGITVDRAARGLGAGRVLTAALTRAGLARSEVVTLGLDHPNPAAESLYLDLGFTVAHEWRSARLRPR